MWVATSDAAGFYESVGYQLVGERWIAKENPKWDGGPIPVRIVSSSWIVHVWNSVDPAAAAADDTPTDIGV